MLESICEQIAGLIAPKLVNRRNELERLVNIDHLTGLGNRAAFDKAEPLARMNYSFIIFDINNFGKVNKTAGHTHGDQILKRFSDVIVNVCYNFKARAFRYGGDEFVVICLPRFAKQLRDAIETRALDVDFGNFIVSLSGEFAPTLDEADSKLQARKVARKLSIKTHKTR